MTLPKNLASGPRPSRSRSRQWAALTALLACLVLPSAAGAQESPQTAERPRIGLVLGGGGARGGAHVGVLRVLEEMRVPVDYIAGTSMGAVIGGAYASGMSPDEIEELLNGIDWDDLFRSSPPRQDLVFRRKQDTRAFPMDVELGFDGRAFRLPPSLIRGHNLNLLIRTVTLPVAEVRDFDDLPIPFRATATDIADGQLVVLSQGDLSRAILASMAVPGGFEAIEIDGRLLVDGGLVRNLPVDVVRDMGADVVIVADVGTPLAGREEIRDAFGVAGQMLTILTDANARTQRETLVEGDVLIRPDLGEISLASFDQTVATIPHGEAATRSRAAELGVYAVSEEAYAPYIARRIPRQTELTIDFIDMENETGLSDAVLAGLLDLEVGQTVDVTELRRSLTLLQGAGDFDKVDFDIITTGGESGLRVRPLEKPWGPAYLRFGIFVQDDVESFSSFNLLARFTLTRLNQLGGELRVQGRLGQTRGLFAEWYQPLDNRLSLFGALSGRVSTERSTFWVDGIPLAEYRTDRQDLRLSVGRRLGLWGQVRASLLTEWIDGRPEVGDPDLPEFEEAQTSITVDFSVDEHDDARFPTHGVAAFVDWKHADEFLGGNLKFDRLSAAVVPAFSRGRNAVVLQGLAGTSFGTELPLYDQFTLGGFLRLSGLQPEELRGRYAGFASATYFRRLSPPRGLALVGGFRLGGSLETGNTWDESADIGNDLRLAGSVFAAMETILGPIYVGYGRADGGSDSWYFFLGRLF